MGHLLNTPRVLMMGPSLDMHGGVASVIKGYFDSGLADCCQLYYIPTVTDGPIVNKATYFAKAYFKCARLVNTADVVHIHTAMRGSFERKYRIARLAFQARVPIIIHEHDGEFPLLYESSSETYKRRVKSFFGWAEQVIVLSEAWKNYYSRNGICSESKITVMHNAVNLPVESVNVGANQSILFLGRLDSNKSPDVLLKAAAHVVDRYPEARFVFAGEGELNRYKSMAKKLKIEANCDFTGWISGHDKDLYVKQAGLFCLPSKNEGMPMSMLEMMSYGIPCVMTPVGGVPQVIEDGYNGFLVPVDDVELLSSVLCRVLASPRLREEIGRRARMTVRTNFDIKQNVNKLIRIYAQCLSR